MQVALIGNPNSGKTTLFNALTGSTLRVGNWPGVTVDRCEGSWGHASDRVLAIDLPGIYSLTHQTQYGLDAKITCEYIRSHAADFLVNVIDASQLEHQLYLTAQLLALHSPMMVVLNMMDVVKRRGQSIEVGLLEQALGCPVVAVCASTLREGDAVESLRQSIVQASRRGVIPQQRVVYPQVIERSVQQLLPWIERLGSVADSDLFFVALRLLEGDEQAILAPDEATGLELNRQLELIRSSEGSDVEVVIASARYDFASQVTNRVVQQALTIKKTWTERIDAVVLHRWMGIPIFLSVMYGTFFFAINVSGVFQDFFDILSETLFVKGLAQGLQVLGVSHALIAIVATGFGTGINTTITFIPVIGGMFLALSFLEASGYMARAAFLVDRVMRPLGLPGKAFVPMIVGFGCNVPAVMGARTLENPRDRIMSIMMAPFMSCGARLAIYAVFIAAFFPEGGHNIVFMLYSVGIVVAVLTGLMLRKTLLSGPPTPLVMELPNYHWPHFRVLMRHTWNRLRNFVCRAGKVIIPVCVLLGAMNAMKVDGTISLGDAHQDSVLSVLGKRVTPVFAPMGIHQDNWPATVGLVTGILAKEVVVGTLNALYTQTLGFEQTADFHWVEGLKSAWQSVGANVVALTEAIKHPLLSSAPLQALDKRVYGAMVERFAGQAGALAYLLFVLLYFPCVSTLAVTWRELNMGWGLFSLGWNTAIAYSVAVLYYQWATVGQHPEQTAVWVIVIFAVFLAIGWTMRYYVRVGKPLASLPSLPSLPPTVAEYPIRWVSKSRGGVRSNGMSSF